MYYTFSSNYHYKKSSNALNALYFYFLYKNHYLKEYVMYSFCLLNSALKTYTDSSPNGCGNEGRELFFTGLKKSERNVSE
jgi:hypothetical protein